MPDMGGRGSAVAAFGLTLAGLAVVYHGLSGASPILWTYTQEGLDKAREGRAIVAAGVGVRAGEQRVDLLEVRFHALLHRVQDLARRGDAVGGDRELLADPAALLERAERPLELPAHRRRVQALGLAAGHQHAG